MARSSESTPMAVCAPGLARVCTCATWKGRGEGLHDMNSYTRGLGGRMAGKRYQEEGKKEGWEKMGVGVGRPCWAALGLCTQQGL